MSKKHKYQRKLSHKTGSYGTDLTEYDGEILPNPEDGRIQSDGMFHEYYGFDYFTEQVIEKSRKEFKIKVINKIGIEDYEKIESGLKDYALSSSDDKITPALSLLYFSLFDNNPNILIENYDYQLDEMVHHVPVGYFKRYTFLDSLKYEPNELINKISLKWYAKLAEKITKKYLKKYVRHIRKNQSEPLIENARTMTIYRGISNDKYYQNNDTDILAMYTGAKSGLLFFEKNLLTSYSLSQNVGNKFMVGTLNHKGQRRVLIIGPFAVLKKRIFSSFIVSESFTDEQYELLCFPNFKNLYMYDKKNDEINAEFVLSKIENNESTLYFS
ncbi:MAG: hypothetical protein U0W24_00790 [Bacteroidales bacterium]